MSALRQHQEVSRLTGVTKKVYECVPALESQQVHKIMGALKVMTGSSADKHIVSHCLDDLVDSGVIKRIGIDRYQRVLVSASNQEQEKVTIKKAPAKEEKLEPKASAIDTLSQIASEMRECASNFASRFKLIADRIDDAAILIEQESEESSEATVKLRQLQTLLKGL